MLQPHHHLACNQGLCLRLENFSLFVPDVSQMCLGDKCGRNKNKSSLSHAFISHISPQTVFNNHIGEMEIFLVFLFNLVVLCLLNHNFDICNTTFMQPDAVRGPATSKNYKNLIVWIFSFGLSKNYTEKTLKQ